MYHSEKHGKSEKMVFAEGELLQMGQLQSSSFHSLLDYEKMARAKPQRNIERTVYKMYSKSMHSEGLMVHVKYMQPLQSHTKRKVQSESVNIYHKSSPGNTLDPSPLKLICNSEVNQDPQVIKKPDTKQESNTNS